MIFLVEHCKTPIYNRIALAFGNALQNLGHSVYFFNPQDLDDASFSDAVNALDIDCYLSTNVFNRLQAYNELTKGFNFESVRHRMLFIHHDSAFCPPDTVQKIDRKLNALIEHQGKIAHFFIESANIGQFNSVGIQDCHLIHHASEFLPVQGPADFDHEISFVGHLMSGLGLYPLSRADMGHHLMALAWNRYSRSSFKIQPEIERLEKDEFLMRAMNLPAVHQLSRHRYLMQLATNLTMAYRGEVISNLRNQIVHIYGGDVSYGSIDNPLMKIDREHVVYRAATIDYSSTASIYAKSKISLNISSLQFDTAINNRIIDVILAGGFILTDKRDDLAFLGDLADEITFETPEELQYKIDFFMDPKNMDRYLEVKTRAYELFKDRHSYEAVCRVILESVETASV